MNQLNEGTNEGYDVECPWHGSKFDVRAGEPTKPPPTRQPSPSYEVKVEGNNIHTSKRSMITNILDVGYGGREIVTMIMMIPSSKKFKHL